MSGDSLFHAGERLLLRKLTSGAHSMGVCRCQAADLSKNGIGVRGTTALVEALQQNENLQTLVLDTNSIGDEGAEILAKHLSSAVLQLHDPHPNCTLYTWYYE